MESKAPRTRAMALVVALFLLGIAIGALGTYVVSARSHGSSEHATNRIVKKLTHELNLTADQQGQLTAIIEDTRSKYRALDEQVRPQREQIHKQARDKIRTLLTSGQKPKFEEFLRHLDQEHAKSEQREVGNGR